MEKLRELSTKFLNITPREQYLITISGIVVIALLMFNFFIDSLIANINKHKLVVGEAQVSVQANSQSIALMEEALANDPNQQIKHEIAQLENKLTDIDGQLLALTSDLIDPVQMRFALLDLLKFKRGISLVSLEVMPVESLLSFAEAEQSDAEKPLEQVVTVGPVETEGLYKHSIKIKLSGRYFDLRDYLKELETMKWTFFWQEFDYKLKEYPVSELEVTLYSLSTKREFIGV